MASDEDGRALDVLAFAGARATEMRATAHTLQQHPDLEGGGMEGQGRGNRRRANSHKPRLTHRRRPNAKRMQAMQGCEEPNFPDNRDMRRRRGRLQERIEREFRDPNQRHGRSMRLVTHRWHAKRFQMDTKWNVKMPTHVMGKGKGIKSVLRAAKEKAVLHDASYVFPIFLAGTREHRKMLLSKVSDPNTVPVGRTTREEAELEGNVGAYTMLHRCGEFPDGAIGPARVLWNIRVQEKGCKGIHKQTWVLVHVAAYKSALNELIKGAEGLNVAVLPGQGDTCMFQLYGQASHSILTSVLGRSITTDSGNGKVWKIFCKHSSAHRFPNGAICSFRVHDGRLSDQAQAVALSRDDPGGLHLPRWRKLHDKKGAKWDWPLEGPSSQQDISKARCQRRREFLQLGGEDVVVDDQARTCPLLLWQLEGRASGHAGWSIIVPSMWCSSLWHTLLGHGARPIGEEEWNWVLTRGHVSIFPDEYPETEAGRMTGGTSFPWPGQMQVVRNAADTRLKLVEKALLPAEGDSDAARNQLSVGGLEPLPHPTKVPPLVRTNLFVKVAISLVRGSACGRGWAVLEASKEEFMACRRKQFRADTSGSIKTPLGWITSSLSHAQGNNNVAFALCSLEKLLRERERQQGWARLWTSEILVTLSRSHPGGQMHAGAAKICLEGAYTSSSQVILV